MDTDTPRTNAASIRTALFDECGDPVDFDPVDADDMAKLERELAELREIYYLDTQWLKAEASTARSSLRRCHNEYIEVSFNRMAEVETIKAENAALADALLLRLVTSFCDDCDAMLTDCGKHRETCRHYETERKVMQ